MKRRNGRKQDVQLWNDFWSAIAPGRAERSSSTARFSYMPSTTAGMNGAPMVVTVPGSTVFVSTTIIATTFVTVPGATVTLPLVSSGPSQHPTLQQMTSRTTTAEASTTTSLAAIFSHSAITEGVSGAPVATISASNATATTGSMIGEHGRDEAQKHAIIGGLSGSIAGLIFIGLLICLVLRMKRKKGEPKECDDSSSEKGIRPALMRKWTQLTGGGIGSPKQVHFADRSATPATVDEDHRIIRMNTRHWPRPFAAGMGEGYRESQPQGTLRVVNPDPSRPATPRKSSDTALRHFNKQRPSLAGLVFNVPNDSPNARLQPNSALQRPIPTITVIDPNLSRECIATYDTAPSFKSYPSVASLPVISPHPLEDPFFVPPPLPPASQQREKPALRSSSKTRRRPSVATLQSTTASAGRTWTQLSSHLLHPYAKRTSNAETLQNVRGLSHFSVSSSATRSSRRSDPFDLSIRGSQPPREACEFRRGSPNPNWILYEGT